MIRIIVNGCNGRMGQVVSSMAATDPDLSVVAGVDKFPASKPNPFPVFPSILECDVAADVIVDFSRPEALPGILEYASNHNTAVLVATTGLAKDDLELIDSYSKKIPIFTSANMSLGVNLMMELIQKAASFLGDGFDIEIIEKHHNQKVDSPSGTALALANAINEVFLNAKHYIYGRHSKSEKRSTSEIGIHAVRGGSIVGEHQVLFAGKDEILEINHIALSNQIFAVGTLRAVKYMAGRKAGLYRMQDILLEQSPVTNIYTDNDQAMITINHMHYQPRLIASLFNDIGENHINVDMISQTISSDGTVGISFTVLKKDLNLAFPLLQDFQEKARNIHLDIHEAVTKLTVEGLGMERQAGIAARLFTILSEQDIHIKIITTSETKISYIIDHSDEKKAVESIMQAFDL